MLKSVSFKKRSLITCGILNKRADIKNNFQFVSHNFEPGIIEVAHK
jgi:hypothetical protein